MKQAFRNSSRDGECSNVVIPSRGDGFILYTNAPIHELGVVLMQHD